MHYLRFVLLAISFLSCIIILGCSFQTSDQKSLNPACEPRSNSDPGRLNIRVNAENYGAVSPCEGRIEIYVNQNSEVRNLDLQLIYLNISDSVLSKEQIRMELEDTPTGMYQKEVPLSRIARESCRNVQINIQTMVCFSADRSAVECPQVRIHQPDTYRLISVDDKSIEVCSAG